MKGKRYSNGQIVYALKRVEAGEKAREVGRQLGVSEATFYLWKKKYAGMGFLLQFGEGFIQSDQCRSITAGEWDFGHQFCIHFKWDAVNTTAFGRAENVFQIGYAVSLRSWIFRPSLEASERNVYALHYFPAPGQIAYQIHFCGREWSTVGAENIVKPNRRIVRVIRILRLVVGEDFVRFRASSMRVRFPLAEWLPVPNQTPRTSAGLPVVASVTSIQTALSERND